MNWEFVGAIVGTVSLVITLILEWPRLTSRFGVHTSFKRIVSRIVTGLVIGAAVGVLVGILLYMVSTYFSTLFDFPVLQFSIVIMRSTSFWMVGVVIISILGVTQENIYSSSLKVLIRGMLFGFVLGPSVSFVVYLLYYSLNPHYAASVVQLINIIDDTITTAIGSALVGAIFGGIANRAAKFLFTTG